MELPPYLNSYGPYIWELALAVIFTAIGAIYSRKELGKRERKRVLEELTNIQREMHRRATKDWSEQGAREVWMIGLYFERVETLRSMLDDRESLRLNTSQLFESYTNSLRNFGAVWADAQRRSDNFRVAYKKTYTLYHQLVRELSQQYVIENQPVMEMLEEV